jgi:hypothetical protein
MTSTGLFLLLVGGLSSSRPVADSEENAYFGGQATSTQHQGLMA